MSFRFIFTNVAGQLDTEVTCQIAKGIGATPTSNQFYETLPIVKNDLPFNHSGVAKKLVLIRSKHIHIMKQPLWVENPHVLHVQKLNGDFLTDKVRRWAIPGAHDVTWAMNAQRKRSFSNDGAVRTNT